MNREELVEKYGCPKRIKDVVEGQVLAFEHDSYESAYEYYLANKEHYGHPGWIECDGDRFISVVDLRPAIAELEQEELDE